MKAHGRFRRLCPEISAYYHGIRHHPSRVTRAVQFCRARDPFQNTESGLISVVAPWV